MDSQGVRAVVFDAAVLFEVDSAGSVLLVPDASRFLLRMRPAGSSHISNPLREDWSSLSSDYRGFPSGSQIRSKDTLSSVCGKFSGVLSSNSSHDSLPRKEDLLEEVGVLGTIRIVSLSQELTAGAALKNLGSLWGVPPTSSVYVSAHQNGDTEGDIRDLGWTILHFVAGSEGTGNLLGSEANVEQLQEIPAILANLNKRALGARLVVVGQTMKWSRELDFLKRGAFPMVPNQCGLSFIPIHLDRPLEKQLAVVDVVLHKATDETLSIPSEQFGFPDSVKFSKGMLDLQRYLKNNPNICVVDPLDRISPLLDRVATQNILQSLEIPLQQVVRSPRSVEVTTFEEPWLSQTLESTNMKLPAIVKPQVACGASKAHAMAVVFRKDGFNGLQVPLPAVIQEYVDHGAFQYKMYIVGNKLLGSCRHSTPNSEALAAANNHAPVVVFDSLKSLPTDSSTSLLTTNSGGVLEDLNSEAVQATADWLRKKLGLTIIGFDLVIQAGTGDYVVVDVNYFSSFKDVPDAEAIPAFWDALLSAHRQWPSRNV